MGSAISKHCSNKRPAAILNPRRKPILSRLPSTFAGLNTENIYITPVPFPLCIDAGGQPYESLLMYFIIVEIWFVQYHRYQQNIASPQGFILASGTFGIWLYTFLERILIPTGLHHFIWTPFCPGPAVVDGGAKIYFFQHLSEFATSARTLKEMFPYGGFTLYGMSKMFACPGIALAMYATPGQNAKRRSEASCSPPRLSQPSAALPNHLNLPSYSSPPSCSSSTRCWQPLYRRASLPSASSANLKLGFSTRCSSTGSRCSNTIRRLISSRSSSASVSPQSTSSYSAI